MENEMHYMYQEYEKNEISEKIRDIKSNQNSNSFIDSPKIHSKNNIIIFKLSYYNLKKKMIKE